MLLNCGIGRLLRVPWTARRSNQSILKEISPEYSLKGMMLKLRLQYFGHLMRRTDSLERTLMLEKIEGRRKRRQWMRWLDGLPNSMDMSLSRLREWWWTGMPGVLLSMGSQRIGHNWATELTDIHKKGQEIQNFSLLLKIAMDIVTFKYDYWLVLAGETLTRNLNTVWMQNISRSN